MFRSFIRIAVAALASSVSIAVAGAAVIDGRISFPGSDHPAVTAYVYSLDAARLRTVAVRKDQQEFRVDVPPGRYLVFAAPSEPGAPDVYGAYTRCAAPAGEAAACPDHSLRTVVLDRGMRRTDVAIDDWSLSDADADALDRIRGVAATPGPQPEGAPRFTEYPVAAHAAGADAAAVRATVQLRTLELAGANRTRLRDVAAAGPNFAGDLTTVVAHCGGQCLRVLLIDWGSGKVVEPPELAAIDDALPCRTSEAVLFRRDSRLLSVTRMRDAVIVTQYFVWDPQTESLTLLAVYPRKPGQYCAINPP